MARRVVRRSGKTPTMVSTDKRWSEPVSANLPEKAAAVAARIKADDAEKAKKQKKDK